MSAAELWRSVHEARWDWADRQIEQFAQGLDESLARHFERPRDVAASQFGAALYGKTQVGKTSLILRMLGLEESSQSEVAEVLRAGRSPGMSSTARPTSYAWSTHPERWELAEPSMPPQEMSALEVEEALARHRGVDGRPLLEPGVLEIGIPTRYRRPDGPMVPPRILDLPGAGEKDDVARDFAASLIGKYVPAAQLVVLVVRADDLDDLFSGLAAQMLELSMWTRVPERFRIVVTRTISDLAAQPGLLPAEGLSIHWLRQHLLEQLRTGPGEVVLPDDRHLMARIASVLFPLEYGKSWDELQRTRPETFVMCSPLIDHLVDELTGVLSDEAVEDARRISMVHASRTLELAARRELEARQAVLDELCQRERQAEEEASRALKRVTNLRVMLETARSLAGDLHDAPKFAFGEQKMTLAEQNPAKRNDAVQLGERRAELLERHWRGAWGKWKRSQPVRSLTQRTGVKPPDLDLSLDVRAIYRSKWGCCQRCTSSRAVAALPGRQDLSVCLEKQSAAWRDSQGQVAWDMERERQGWLQAVTRRLELDGLDEPTARARLSAAEVNVQVCVAAAEAAKASRAEQDQRVSSFQPNVEDAHQKARLLRSMLDEGLGFEFRKRLADAQQAGHEEERLVSVLAAMLSLRQSERMSAEGIN